MFQTKFTYFNWILFYVGAETQYFLQSFFLLRIMKPDLSLLKCMYYGGTLDTKIKFTRQFLAQNLEHQI